MTNKDIILKAVNFIEENLKNEIDGFKTSQEVCYSLYHFIRLFQSITGFSPSNYIRQRRLAESVTQLKNTDKKIVDIAYEYQFGSPESFTRSFRKQYGINPTDVRKGKSVTSLPLVFPITADTIYQSGKLRHEPPQLVELNERILIGISFFIKEDTEVNDLGKEWSRFFNEMQTIKHLIKPERFYQLQYWSNNQDIGGMYFFTGAEVEKIENLNPLFVAKTIPAGNYLKFLHKGFSNKVGYTYKYIYNEFLPDTEYKLSYPFNFEYYGEQYKGPCNEDSVSEIYIPTQL